MYLNNLGLEVGHNYLRTGIVDDLEEAIRIIQKAVTAAPPPGRPRPCWTPKNLTIWLGSRFSRIGAMVDLEEAINIGRETVLPIVLRPYKFSKSRPIKYRILAISHQNTL
jgi:hypothetical protein